MKTKIELIKVEEIIKSIQNEKELFNKIMPLIKSIDHYAFRNSIFRGEFNCPYLQSVGNSAFLNSEFSGVFNCSDLQEVGQFAFSLSYFRGEFNCPDLREVGKHAFYHSQFNGEFNCPNLQYVGNGAFELSSFNGTFNCPKLQIIGDYAFANSNFTKITIGANATLGTGCIGAHSDEFINDYEANGRQAGTYVWNGSHWIYQKKDKNMETKEKVMETQIQNSEKNVIAENYTRDEIISALWRFDEGSIGDVFDNVSTEDLYERLNQVSDYTADDLIKAVNEGF